METATDDFNIQQVYYSFMQRNYRNEKERAERAEEVQEERREMDLLMGRKVKRHIRNQHLGYE